MDNEESKPADLSFPPAGPLPKAEALKDSTMVVVLVKRAIAYDGRVIRPERNGEKLIPAQAVMPKRIALRHEADTLDILRDATAEDMANLKA